MTKTGVGTKWVELCRQEFTARTLETALDIANESLSYVIEGRIDRLDVVSVWSTPDRYLGNTITYEIAALRKLT